MSGCRPCCSTPISRYWTVRSEYERLPIEHEDEGLRRYLGVIQSRLDDWGVLADLAGWCLPLDMTTISRIDPMPDFAVDRADHLDRVSGTNAGTGSDPHRATALGCDRFLACIRQLGHFHAPRILARRSMFVRGLAAVLGSARASGQVVCSKYASACSGMNLVRSP